MNNSTPSPLSVIEERKNCYFSRAFSKSVFRHGRLLSLTSTTHGKQPRAASLCKRLLVCGQHVLSDGWHYIIVILNLPLRDQTYMHKTRPWDRGHGVGPSHSLRDYLPQRELFFHTVLLIALGLACVSQSPGFVSVH
ncbi:hypothetical protein BaRGS_00031078, partial [Batillaria attramentaria]